MSTAVQRGTRVECLICEEVSPFILYIYCLIHVSIQLIKFMPIDLYFIILSNKYLTRNSQLSK
jgi:hypothetical protein